MTVRVAINGFGRIGRNILRAVAEAGEMVVVDEAYIRESILNPNAKIVSGFRPDIMPTFQGQISEEGI